jgi:hypothetical protein
MAAILGPLVQQNNQWSAKWTEESLTAMFDVFCPTCEARVLLTPRRIERMRNTTAGIAVSWRCWCGTRGELRTGRSAAGTADRLPAAPARDPVPA